MTICKICKLDHDTMNDLLNEFSSKHTKGKVRGNWLQGIQNDCLNHGWIRDE